MLQITIPAREIAYDEVIYRVCYRHEKARHDSRHYFRHYHLSERLHVVAAEVERRLREMLIHLTESRQHGKYHIRQVKCGMRDKHRSRAEFYRQKRHARRSHKKQHHGNARDYIGIHHRYICNG